jgi:CBS domain-containing protein
MQNVRSIMTPDPACCLATTPLREVARMMSERDCGGIPVVDTDGKPVGFVTDRDIALRAVAAGKAEGIAADAMTTPCKAINGDMSLYDCTNLMELEKIRRVPIVDGDGRIAGIVAVADLARSGRANALDAVVTHVSEPGRKPQ